MTDIIIAILGVAACIWIVWIGIRSDRGLRDQRKAEADALDDPYRSEAAVAEGHDPSCDACLQLEAIGYRYKAPDVLLANGYPVSCISRKTKISEADLIAIAEEVGLVRG